MEVTTGGALEQLELTNGRWETLESRAPGGGGGCPPDMQVPMRQCAEGEASN